MTWYPLALCLLLAYFVSHILSIKAKTFWKSEISSKINDINGIKTYYEARIKRLEDRIEAAKGELAGDSKSTAMHSNPLHHTNPNLL